MSPLSEQLVEQAVEAFHAEYLASFPRGGDEADHVYATRCGVEAVVALLEEDS